MQKIALRHLFGLPNLLDSYEHCYDADTRLAPYGFDPQKQYTDQKAIWAGRDWRREQHECAMKNGLLPGLGTQKRKRFHLPDHDSQRYLTTQPAKKDTRKPTPRTAVIMRTSDNFNWAGDITAYIRSMIVELSLESGGVYELFILVQVKDLKQHIFLDPEAYDRVLRKHVPEEFRGMAYLWNENLLKAWYPEVPDHRSVTSTLISLSSVNRHTATSTRHTKLCSSSPNLSPLTLTFSGNSRWTGGPPPPT